jgi:hypothetical protein
MLAILKRFRKKEDKGAKALRELGAAYEYTRDAMWQLRLERGAQAFDTLLERRSMSFKRP